MQRISQLLGVTEFPLRIKDKHGNRIYYEEPGYWSRTEYDSHGNEVYFENSEGYWERYEYTYGDNPEGSEIYFEDSDGQIRDNRPKEDVIEIDGVKYKKIEE